MSAPAARTCAGCGAEAPRPEARFCEQCGAALAEQRPAPTPGEPLGDVAARFGVLAQLPELPRALQERPEVPELAGKTLPSLLLLLALALIGGFGSLLFLSLCPPLGFLPLVLVVVGAAALARQLLWSARTPLVARPALVLELRAQLQAGAEHSPSQTRHFVTLQDQAGSRSEHECLASAVAGLARGQLGVAWLKGPRLAAFRRLPA